MAVRCTARREEEEIREERIVKEAWQSSEARGNGRRVLFARDGQDQISMRCMSCAAIRRSSHQQAAKARVARVPGPWMGCDWRAGEQGRAAHGLE